MRRSHFAYILVFGASLLSLLLLPSYMPAIAPQSKQLIEAGFIRLRNNRYNNDARRNTHWYVTLVVLIGLIKTTCHHSIVSPNRFRSQSHCVRHILVQKRIHKHRSIILFFTLIARWQGNQTRSKKDRLKSFHSP
ncbi:unnamed protein product [Chrysodeixis includens]|uniref:Uncharacterized protein n=1 Tax=Chrysodeixis includens TaxID=689277 RepID=A0A9N8L4K8_CHRIL|nr:unnamed protein product [Chrysodeixis includens]